MSMYFENAHYDSLYPSHDFPRNWSAMDLADAVPLRLSERMSLGLLEFKAAPRAANNPFAIAPKRGGFRRGYAAGAELTSFRVR
ncbi:MAG TPA: hypothetical protein VGE88_10450 [Lysobacter sp.]